MRARLSLIVRAGAGVNTIDVAGASKRGIYVSNCPGKNSVAVAELTMGLILSVDRRIPDNVAELRAGKWNKKEFSKARGLSGQTLGLIGFGHIGQEVAVRARAFGMPVLVWSRRFSEDAAARAAGGEGLRHPGGGDGGGAGGQGRHPERAPGADQGDARLRQRRAAGAREEGRLLHQHRSRRSGRLRRARSGGEGEGPARRPRRVCQRAGRGDRRLCRHAGGAAQRLWHAPHRRLDRPGAGSDCRGDRAHHHAPSRTPARCRTW